MKTWLKRGVGLLVSVALLAWVVTGARWHGVMASLSLLTAVQLALAVAAFAASYLLRAARVFDEFREETGARFAAILRLTLIHNAMINVVPFRGGEATFPVLLTRWFGLSTTRAVVALLWLRIQDAFVVLALAAFVWPGLHWSMRGLWIAAVLLAAWWIPAWANRHPELEDSAGRMRNTVHKIRAALAESTRRHGRGWLWTIANWSLKLMAEAWLLAALLGASFATGMAGALGVELASILPIQGVAGFGTYEAGGAALAAAHGVSFGDGLNAALALHLFVISCALLAGGIAVAVLPAGPSQPDTDTSRP